MPWAMFLGPEGRLAFALSTMGLQVGIYLCGNFGVFNLMPLVLMISFLCRHATRLGSPSRRYDPSMWASFRGLVAIPLLTKLVESRPLESMCQSGSETSHTCTCCHSRHVPSARAIKNLVCVWYFYASPQLSEAFSSCQMSDDGEHWRDVQTKYLRYKPSETSWHWAPYHPRLDHYFYYTLSRRRL